MTYKKTAQIHIEILLSFLNSVEDVFRLGTRSLEKILYINPGYETIWGESSENLYRQPGTFYDPVHPDDKEHVKKTINRFHKKGEPYECDYRLLKQNGEIRWIQERGYPVREKIEEEDVVACICTDITDRKNHEEILQESWNMLRQITDNFPGVFISVIREDFTVGFTGGKEFYSLGLDPKKFIGCAIEDIFGEKSEFIKKEYNKVFHGEHVNFEIEAGGMIRQYNAVPLYSKSGIHKILAVVENITQRRKNEKLLEFQLKFQENAARIAESLIKVDKTNYDELINESLKNMGEFYDTDRSYIFALSESKKTMSNTHEWCRNGIKPQIGTLQNQNTKDFPFFMQELKKLKPLVIPDTDRLPETAFKEKKEWLRQNIQSLVVTPIIDNSGEIIGFLGFDSVVRKRDWGKNQISMMKILAGILSHSIEGKKTIEKLKLSAAVFTNAREGIAITDPEGSIIDTNEAFSKITGYSKEEVIGKNPRILKSGRHDSRFYKDMWKELSEKGGWQGEIWNRNKNGTIYAELLNISAIKNINEKTTHYIALFTDITSQKEHQKQLEYIAHYDPLTRLPNRVLLADRLNQAMAQTQRRRQKLAVAYIDLDGFKDVNDTYGHKAGDELLITLADRMKQALREGDTIARIGGDEFIAVLIDLNDTYDSVPVLTRILLSAMQSVMYRGQKLQVTASIGVTFYPQEEEPGADLLIRQADQAMYQAKLTGKNRFHIFNPDEDKSLRGIHESRERIRKALTDKEFELYYQPKVNMRVGKIIGAEAMIRWNHPERGVLSPMEFLPIIEDDPFSIDLGEWVLGEALKQLGIWKKEKVEFSLSVNIGAKQLQAADFMDRLRKFLKENPLVQPENLELEILETVALEDIGHVSRVIQKCKEIGINFSLDDFGTGYSSLAYLKQLPATTLKIDKSFVKEMLINPDDLAILEGVQGLASAFRCDLIAEGVETREHGEMLLRLGCEKAQGYFIAHPMPVHKFMDWTKSYTPEPSWLNLSRVSRDDLPVLFAGVEHSAWIRRIELFLMGEQIAPPPLNHHECRFGQWVESEGSARYKGNQKFREIMRMHSVVHDEAINLLSEAPARAREKFQSLLNHRNSLLELLHKLI